MPTIKGIIAGLTRLGYRTVWLAMLVVSLGICIHFFGLIGRSLAQRNKHVLDVIHWRDPKRSGLILAVLLTVLVLFAWCSVLSVVSYLGLLVLVGTISYRVYRGVVGTVQKTGEPGDSNPFRPYLDQPLHIPQARVHDQVDVFVDNAAQLLQHLKGLFLIEDFTESIKFGLVLWALTFIGAWFSGTALLMIDVLAIFSVPKLYEMYKEPIDQHYGTAQQKYAEIYGQVKEKVPFLKEKPVTIKTE